MKSCSFYSIAACPGSRGATVAAVIMEPSGDEQASVVARLIHGHWKTSQQSDSVTEQCIKATALPACTRFGADGSSFSSDMSTPYTANQRLAKASASTAVRCIATDGSPSHDWEKQGVQRIQCFLRKIYNCTVVVCIASDVCLY